MSNQNSNQMRAFANVVSIDAWHGEFTEECSRVDLHADVVFSTARMGGESESKVRFRLSIKRAELVIVIPETEPVKIDPSSVSRTSNQSTGKKTIKTETEKRLSASANAKATVSPFGLAPALDMDAAASGSSTSTEETKIEIELSEFKVQHRKTGDGNYSWVIESEGQNILSGQPWDAVAQPRLQLIDRRLHPTNSLPPVVRLEVRCLREDLEISDIEMKEGDGWFIGFSTVQKERKLKAAEAYIRNKLEEEGLSSVDMDENFSEIIMAHITAGVI